MITVALADHSITIDPPQRLLLLEVTGEDGATLKILHKSGREDDSKFELMWKSPSWENSGSTEAGVVPSLIPQAYLNVIPLVAKLDAWELSSDYKAVSPQVPEAFLFRTGQSYSVVLVSELLLQTNVVAT